MEGNGVLIANFKELNQEWKIYLKKNLGCKKCKYLESDISKKMTTPFTCPRCALEGIKSDLKDYPNHLLTCRNCQWLGKQVGTTIIEA